MVFDHIEIKFQTEITCVRALIGRHIVSLATFTKPIATCSTVISFLLPSGCDDEKVLIWKENEDSGIMRIQYTCFKIVLSEIENMLRIDKSSIQHKTCTRQQFLLGLLSDEACAKLHIMSMQET